MGTTKNQKYSVELTKDEQDYLLSLVSSGKHTSQEILHANILLAADRNQATHYSRTEIENMYHCGHGTVIRTCQRYFEKGLYRAVFRKKRMTPPVEPKITGEIEAKIIALSCSEPPEGYARWSTRLLADRIVELEILESISHQSVHNVLKKKSAETSFEKRMGNS